MDADVTLLLRAYREGDIESLDALAELVYPELKAMARRRTGGAGSMGATTLVQETFLKLLAADRVVAEDRQQFFGLMATIMRQIVVDEVRYFSAHKRDAQAVTYTDRLDTGRADDHDFLLLVDRVLSALERDNVQLVKVFEARYFAGYSAEETAQALGISLRSSERLWAAARRQVATLVSDEVNQGRTNA